MSKLIKVIAGARLKHFILFCIALYTVVISIIFLSVNSVSYDEMWFAGYKIDRLENYLGYGAFYWSIVKSLRQLFQSPYLGLRILMLIIWLIVPIKLYFMRNYRKVKFESQDQLSFVQVVCISLIWMTMPMAWWFGKIIGIEILVTVIGFLGISELELRKTKRRELIGIFLVFLAVGLKPNYLSLVVYIFPFFIDIFKNKNSRNKEFIIFSLTCFFGFSLANPQWLFELNSFIKNIMNFSGTNEYSTIAMTFSTRVWSFWEMVPIYSLAGSSIQVPTILLLCWLFFRKQISIDRNYRGSYLKVVFVFMLNAILIHRTSAYLNWYWLPTIISILTTFCFFKATDKVWLSIIATNFFISMPAILSNFYIKSSDIHLISHKEQLDTFIQSTCDQLKCRGEQFKATSIVMQDYNIRKIIDLSRGLKHTESYFSVVVSENMLIPDFACSSNHLCYMLDVFSSTLYKNLINDFSKNGYTVDFKNDESLRVTVITLKK